MKDAAIVLFLNSIDEQVYVIVQKLRPVWIDELEADIIESSLSYWHQDMSDICEVIDDPDDTNYSNNLELGQQADVSNILCDDVEMNELIIEKLKTRVDLVREASSVEAEQIIRANEIDIAEAQRLCENKINRLIQQYEDEKQKIKKYHEKTISEFTKVCEADKLKTAKDAGVLIESEITSIATEELEKSQSKINDYFF